MAGSSMEPVEPDKTAAEMEPIVSCSDREVCFGLHAQCWAYSSYLEARS